jgi:coenzyme F420-reducing hydrogenase beta subunit
MNLTLNESCYHCQDACVPRRSDLTIADFWGLGFKEPFSLKSEIHKGVSLVLVNNATGYSFFEKAKKYLYVCERSFEEACRQNKPMQHSSKRPIQRESFYSDLSQMKFDDVCTKYFRKTIKSRIVTFLREYMPPILSIALRRLKQK